MTTYRFHEMFRAFIRLQIQMCSPKWYLSVACGFYIHGPIFLKKKADPEADARSSFVDPDPYFLDLHDPDPKLFLRIRNSIIKKIAVLWLNDFLSLKIDEHAVYVQKVTSKRTWKKENVFLLSSWRSLTKREGSGSVPKYTGTKIYCRHPNRALGPEFFYSDISSLAGSGFTIR